MDDNCCSDQLGRGLDSDTKVTIGVKTHELDICLIDHLQNLLYILKDDEGVRWDHEGVDMAESGWAVLVVNDGLQPPVVRVSNSLLSHGCGRGGKWGGRMRGHNSEGGAWIEKGAHKCNKSAQTFNINTKCTKSAELT